MSNIAPNQSVKIRLGTYNVCEMRDHINDPETRDGVRAKPAAEIAAVANVIRDSGVDILSLQEIENDEVFQSLLDERGLRALFPHSKFIEGNDKHTGFDVAVLSKFPIKRYVTHKDESISEKDPSIKFQRDLLEVDVALPNSETLRVFSTHFVRQSEPHWKNPEFYDKKRESEARAAIEIVKRQAKGLPVDYQVVMGDFNGDDESRVMQLFRAEPTLTNSSEGLAASWGLLRPGGKHPPSRLDHIVVGEKLKRRVVGAGVFEHSDAAVASDHSLVYTDFLVA